MKQLPRGLPELAAIERLASAALRGGSVDVLATVDELPIHAFRFGPDDRTTPALLVTGGVHGLERIGTDVAIAYLTTLVARLRWDDVLRDALARCRVIVVPLVNPVGMARGQRANGNGVDLMRNAPPAALGGTPLVGGQQLSPRLPWYMGPPGAAMQAEAAALAALVERELFGAPLAIALDLHSGFGFVDRLWYPYARTREPPPDLGAIAALGQLLDDTLPNHVYRVEQTARAYTIRGDLWDHLYDRRRAAGAGTLLPLTLEMGSWAWVRKNPLQGLSSLGRFNPVKPHRHRRTLRRHLPLLDFLLHAAASYRAWL
ncbi:MAG TPA: DUF2817 domain-containing protein [Kofleriaceae bacterium]|nr:DUF2817 domain-containing protein [Kofleriaceae bacterium]